MTKSFLCSLAVFAMQLSVAPAVADEAGVEVVFTGGEATITRAYYQDRNAPQKNKRKGSKGLPPGIAKNLQRGKPLPPGIAKQSLPNGLIDLLPPPPAGFERVALSGKVLPVEIATQVNHDVLEDVILEQ